MSDAEPEQAPPPVQVGPGRGWVLAPEPLRSRVLFAPSLRRAAQAALALGWRVWRLGLDHELTPTWAQEPRLPGPGLRDDDDPRRAVWQSLAEGADDDEPAQLLDHPSYAPAPVGESPRPARSPSHWSLAHARPAQSLPPGLPDQPPARRRRR